MRPNILITGATGQVGFELARVFNLDGDVLTPTRHELDLTNLGDVATYLNQHKPRLILNAAAYTAVDKAESEPDLCQIINASLPSVLALYCAREGVPMVHFSSDYVYPGDGNVAWREDSPTGPLSVYGESKLAGDMEVLDYLADGHIPFYILRTSWVYSARGHNFMKTMLRLGAEREQLSVVDDQIGAPTPARLLAQFAQRLLAADAPYGIYHAAPAGETSWCGFAQEIFKQAIASGANLAIQPEQVASIATSAYPTPAKRPLNSRLDLQKIETALGRTMPSWQSELSLTLREFLEK